MRHRILLITCLLFSAVAIHTAVQIEYKNIQSGNFLPRFPSDHPVPKWEIPELKEVLASLDEKFYVRREEAALVALRAEAEASKPEANVANAAKLLATETDPNLTTNEVATNLVKAEPAISPPLDIPYGAPYSEQEQRTIDSLTQLHASHIELRWWVSKFGMVQYILAPATFLLALFCAVSLPGARKKSTAALCAFLCATCIFLMLVRGYWHAMGAELSAFTAAPSTVNNLFV